MNKSIDVTEVWKHQGYLTDVPIFSSREIQKYRELFDEMEKNEGQETAETGFHNRHFESEFIWRLSTSPIILSHVQSLIGSNVLLLGTHFFCKYPSDLRGEKFIAWHQDVTYWGLEPPLAITAWLAIDDVDRENGCMRVIPKSHKQGILQHGKSDIKGNLLSINQEVSPNSFSGQQPVDLTLKAGQMSIHHGLLIHGSNPNASNRRRCGLAIRFIPSKVRQIKRNSLGKFYKAILISGEDHYHHFPQQQVPFLK